MDLNEFKDKYLLATDSDSEIPILSEDEMRRYVEACRELGVKMVFGAQINAETMRQLQQGCLAVGRLAGLGGVDVGQKILNKSNIWVGHYPDEQTAGLAWFDLGSEKI